MRHRILGASSLLMLAPFVLSACDDDDDDFVVIAGPQLGSLSISITSGVVTVTAQPPALPLAGTSAYDDVADTLTVSLRVANASSRYVFNPKVVVRSLNQGTVFNLDGSYEGDPYLYYGLTALVPGGTVTEDIEITGVDGTVDPILVDVEIFNHPMHFVSAGWNDGLAAFDSSGTGEGDRILSEPVGFVGAASDSLFTGGVASRDGRFVYVGNRNQPAVVVIDTTTMLAVNSTDLTGAGNIQTDGTGSIGFTNDVAMSPDGAVLYTVLTTGDHKAPWGGGGVVAHPVGAQPEDVYVVKLLRSNLAELGRVNLVTASAMSARGTGISLSADGTLGAVAIINEGLVFLVNLVTMTIVDADPVTPGDQPFDVSGTSLEPLQVALSPDGSSIYVAYRSNDGTLDEIDVATGTITPLAPMTLSGAGSNLPGFLTFGSDGRMYYGRKNAPTAPGLSIYDPVGMAWTELLPTQQGHAFAMSGDTYYVYSDFGTHAFAFDATTDTPVLNPADGAPSIPVPDGDFGHGYAMTPF